MADKLFEAIQSQRTARARALNVVPASILEDEDINAAIALLPPNYAFEIPKTIHRIRTTEAKRVALQFPEGLLLFATTISDILRQFCPSVDDVLIMGDVTYGACCVDDYTARALGCDMLVHYAHSCLVPVSVTPGIKTLYVFVDISIDVPHLLATVRRNFQPGKTIALVGTIQFNATVHSIVPELRREGYDIVIPQSAPLSRGEILGCTAPTLATRNSTTAKDIPTDPKERRKAPLVADILLYLGDGRFHLEAAMIANPSLPSYRYDPYSRRLTRESFDHDTMLGARRQAITTARKAKRWGLILGALGRQGNPHTLELIEKKAAEQGIDCMRIVLSEIFPGKLAMMSQDVGAWVQVACPRLSIDWGYAFERPLMSPYEAFVALRVKEGNWLLGEERLEEEKEQSEKREVVYPMDYYAKEGLGRVRRQDVVVG